MSLPQWLWNATFARTKNGLPLKGSSDHGYSELVEVDDSADAQVITSKMINRDNRYRVLLDLDIQHHYMVSSSGNGHLILDVDLTREEHDELLDVLERLRIIQPGYAKASKARPLGGSLRLPWVKKGEDKTYNELKKEAKDTGLT